MKFFGLGTSRLFTLLMTWIILCPSVLFSQPDPPPGGPGSGDPPVGGAPIEGGMAIFLVLGLIYASWFARAAWLEWKAVKPGNASHF